MTRVTAVLILALLVMLSSPFRAGAEQNCLAWERSMRNSNGSQGAGGVGAPAVGQNGPQGQLLNQWVADDCMRLNYVQVLGTHNSYHIQPIPQILQFLATNLGPAIPASMEYTHKPLDQQLDVLGIRQVELDVFADPQGGLFAAPIGALVFPDPSYPVPMPGLLAPGLKVLHTQDVDYNTTCLTFVACLQVIKGWSDAHPGHLPITILVEAKDESLVLPPQVLLLLQQLGLSPVEPVPFDSAALDTIDDEILSVFSPQDVIMPDDVRGGRGTLEQAVLKDGWPTLNSSRGKVMFALDNDDEKRDAYIAGHPSLAGRVMFTNSPPGTPESAFVEVDDPIAGFDLIQKWVAQGYLVRTRADADTLEARLGVTARRDAALTSGAQFVSTDYPEPNPAPNFSGYFVEIPGGMNYRCNPVLSPPGCDPSTLESPVLGLSAGFQ